jgi:hypothetical protein
MYGDVAQLGERAVRIRKVESSILFVSTIPFRPVGRFFYGKAVSHFLRKHIESALPE